MCSWCVLQCRESTARSMYSLGHFMIWIKFYMPICFIFLLSLPSWRPGPGGYPGHNIKMRLPSSHPPSTNSSEAFLKVLFKNTSRTQTDKLAVWLKGGRLWGWNQSAPWTTYNQTHLQQIIHTQVAEGSLRTGNESTYNWNVYVTSGDRNNLKEIIIYREWRGVTSGFPWKRFFSNFHFLHFFNMNGYIHTHVCVCVCYVLARHSRHYSINLQNECTTFKNKSVLKYLC